MWIRFHASCDAAVPRRCDAVPLLRYALLVRIKRLIRSYELYHLRPRIPGCRGGRTIFDLLRVHTLYKGWEDQQFYSSVYIFFIKTITLLCKGSYEAKNSEICVYVSYVQPKLIAPRNHLLFLKEILSLVDFCLPVECWCGIWFRPSSISRRLRRFSSISTSRRQRLWCDFL